MSAYSLAAGLMRTLPEHFMHYDEDFADSYDVIIKFRSAKKLPKMDMIGYDDPYFVAKLNHRMSYTSAISPNTSEPIWENEEWIIRNIPRNSSLTIKLYNKDEKKLVDGYIGRFVIPDIVQYQPPQNGHQILGALGQPSGRFFLSIQSMASSDETKRLPRYTFDGPCRYFRHDSFAVGRLTMLDADCVYSTWKIPLGRISVFFPPYQRQHWNTQYKAAQFIFNRSPSSVLSKSSIKFTHKALYTRTVEHSENGRLNSADDLWKHVFAHKTTKQIKPCIYTYIIDNYTWRFSETGRQFFADFASKHALLANGSEYVRYAGEFHVRPRKGWKNWDPSDATNENWEIVFDNGSGTYAPSSDLLKNLKELFLFNFPGLHVATYDFKDPRLKESIEQLKLEMEKYKLITKNIGQLVNQFRPTVADNQRNKNLNKTI
ncbi:unnamed protein product [Adineta ricciae]|uniref:C2 domain-containing protein n=1 Tax=Adineta ricciae TaxID=249248 RepID=A0A813NVA2_ADIRI|nr:unnamed protein product [Adineta ricciae]CAF0889542.1 unnamed protein product [Adineta ricciae]